jgi:hypothetical protein
VDSAGVLKVGMLRLRDKDRNAILIAPLSMTNGTYAPTSAGSVW